MRSTEVQPLVSCLCVTERRPELFLRAYESYGAQSYENRELVVVLMDDDPGTEAVVFGLARNDPSITVVVLSRDRQLTLGDRRNCSIDACHGEYICVWDDDDVYHPERISRSMDALRWSGKKAMALDRVILHDVSAGQAYLSTRRIWEQTLICRKEVLSTNGVRYASLNRGEDTALVLQLGQDIFPVTDPTLYIYCFHGANTSSTTHFHEHLAVADRLSDEQSTVVKQLTEQTVTPRSGAVCSTEPALLATVDLVTDRIYKPWGVNAFSIYPYPVQPHTAARLSR